MTYRFDNMKLEKGMYQEAGQTFTQVLERNDPTEAYKGTNLEGLDAFQRQLKRFDIKVKGTNSDVVERFFCSADAAVLFPEYVARAVRQGLEENDVSAEIAAAVTTIDSLDYRSLTSQSDDKSMSYVGEGAEIPSTTILAQENLVKLKKRGRMLVASYEAIRHQKLDLFGVSLRQIGAQMARMNLEDAVATIMDGDGNDNPATVLDVATPDSLTYQDLLEFWAKFDPYEMNTMLVSNDVMMKLLAMEEFQNPLTGLNFQATGKLTTPLGANLIRSAAVPDGTIIGLDKRFALEMVRCGDVSIEYDKLIHRQLERAAITTTSGFAKIFTDASMVMSL
ncbi:MAG: phage major capsid protein [Eubacteriales bacterium]